MMKWFAVGVAVLASGLAHAAGLNDRSRMEEGTLGLPLDSLFKQGPLGTDTRRDANPFMPGFFDPLASESSRPARPADPPLGSTLGGRRKRP